MLKNVKHIHEHSPLHKMLSRLSLIPILCFFYSLSFSQALSQSVLAERLCRTWMIEKIVQPDNSSASAGVMVSDFVLNIHADHTVQQGMNPDGLINGTWTLDEKTRIFTVKDNETATVYPMKIISVTTGDLILQDVSGVSSVTIYYKAK